MHLHILRAFRAKYGVVQMWREMRRVDVGLQLGHAPERSRCSASTSSLWRRGAPASGAREQRRPCLQQIERAA